MTIAMYPCKVCGRRLALDAPSCLGCNTQDPLNQKQREADRKSRAEFRRKMLGFAILAAGVVAFLSVAIPVLKDPSKLFEPTETVEQILRGR